MNVGDAAVARLRATLEHPGTDTDARYEIRERIGEGGMGAVFLAHDRELGREVALKVLRSPATSVDDRARMVREARILARLEHPGIIPVHDVGTLDDGRVFYVMKRVHGVTFDDPALAGRSRSERLRMFLQVCDAIAFAHAAGIVHRDIKPRNIMIGAFGEVLVLDWGVARTATVASGESVVAPPRSPTRGDTVTGDVLGTPGYMAPEQEGGHTGVIDARTDVFGLGGVLWFLCMRTHPDDDLRVPRGVPRSLVAIAAKARAHAPGARYESAAALATDVMNYLDGLPVSAYRESALERLRRVVARHETAILLVLGYLVMRMALLAFGGP